MRRGFEPVEQASFAEDQRAGADGEQQLDFGRLLANPGLVFLIKKIFEP